MLKKGKRKRPLDPNTTDTLIGEGSSFEGNINSDASIRIEGEITGDIKCKGDVTVGDQGIANSSIAARNVIIAGKVRGNIVTSDKLTITATGQLHGNVTSSKLVIDDGGIFMGKSQMGVSEGEQKEQASETINQQQQQSTTFNRGYTDSASNM